jgi:integrase
VARKYINSNKYQGIYYFIEKGEKYYLFRFSYSVFTDGILKKKYMIKIVGRASQGVTEESTLLAKLKCREEIRDSGLGFAPIFNAIAEKYFATKATQVKSLANLYATYKKYIKNAAFANLSLDEIKTKDIIDWQNILLGKHTLSPKTVQVYTEIITAIFNFAKNSHLDNGCLQNVRIPSSMAKIKNANKRRIRVLSNEEISLLLTFLTNKNPNFYLFVLLALNIGGRFRAIMNIKKKDVNLERLTINIRDTKVYKTFSTFINKNIFDAIKERVELINEPEGLIFGYDAKNQKTIANFQKKLLDILNKLFNQGLSTKDSENRIVIHSLRHTFATSLVSKGTPLSIVQKQLNHSNYNQTQRYITLSNESGREYLERLDYATDSKT